MAWNSFLVLKIRFVLEMSFFVILSVFLFLVIVIFSSLLLLQELELAIHACSKVSTDISVLQEIIIHV